MVKFESFLGLTFHPNLYPMLKKDLEHLKHKESNTLIVDFDPEQLIEQGMLKEEKKKLAYLYEQEYQGGSALGLIGEISVQDYCERRIKRHEETLDRESEGLGEDTIMEECVAPVVVGHRHCDLIDQILVKIKETIKPYAQWKSIDGRKHKLWKIKDSKQITNLFNKKIDNLYILDGHHRLKAAGQHLQKQGQKIEQKHRWLMGILYSSKYIKVFPQYRQLQAKNSKQIIQKILQQKTIKTEQLKNSPLSSLTPHNIILLSPSNSASVCINHVNGDCLGVQLLSCLLKPFKAKIKYIPSVLMEQIKAKQHPIFVFQAPSIEKIFQYGDQGKVLPAKSTWLEPKPCLHMVVRLPYDLEQGKQKGKQEKKEKQAKQHYSKQKKQ